MRERPIMLNQNLSPQDNLKMVVEAFLGTKEAREVHASLRNRALTIEAGLKIIKSRWPDLRSTNVSEPIFVFSAGWRSGSTLLQRAILTNEETLIWGEPYCHSGLIQSLASQVRAFTDCWPIDEFFIDRFSNDDLSQQWVANLYPSMQSFLDAHIAYFELLFATPAKALGKQRWGFKDTRLGTDCALYLKWLYPYAKFIFLYRNPYHAFCSYRKWRRWYKTWPDEPIFTPRQFGKHWKNLVDDFLANHEKVGGILLQYEKLHGADTGREIQDYLGIRSTDLKNLNRLGSSYDGRIWIPKIEFFLLRREVEPTASSLGYKEL